MKNGSIFQVPNPHNLINPVAVSQICHIRFATIYNMCVCVCKRRRQNRIGQTSPVHAARPAALRLTSLPRTKKLILLLKSISLHRCVCCCVRYDARIRITEMFCICYPATYKISFPRGTTLWLRRVAACVCVARYTHISL